MTHIEEYIKSKMKTFCNRKSMICSLVVVAFIKASSSIKRLGSTLWLQNKLFSNTQCQYTINVNNFIE